MKVSKEGASFGFCPGKATWDTLTNDIFKALTICCEIGTMWEAGGIENQPDWFLDMLSWFAPRYDQAKFVSRAKMILGEAKDGRPKGTRIQDISGSRRSQKGY